MKNDKVTIAQILIPAILVFTIIAFSISLFYYKEEYYRREEEYYSKLQQIRFKELKEKGIKVLNVPFVKQKPWYCSEASASMVLKYYGYNITQDEVHNAGYDRFENILPFLNKFIKCKYAILTLNDLKREIDEGKPIIIRILIGEYLHTVVVVGYNDDNFYIHDPAIGPYVEISGRRLLSLWSRNKCRAIVILEKHDRKD